MQIALPPAAAVVRELLSVMGSVSYLLPAETYHESKQGWNLRRERNTNRNQFLFIQGHSDASQAGQQDLVVSHQARVRPYLTFHFKPSPSVFICVLLGIYMYMFY